MAARDFVTVVEIDLDYCTRTFGTSPCLASLGAATPRKCYNTYGTCAYTSAFNKGTKTLKFSDVGVKGGVCYPCIKSVGGYEQTVNIAGFSDDIGGLGQRASINIKMADFPDADTLTDKYFSGRRTGAAQIDEPGYKPEERGSFWSKLKARNPNFGGRPLRVINGYLNNSGGLVPVKTRNYVVAEIDGPDSNGDYSVKAKDILSLADNEKALAPVTSRGYLSADISETDTTFAILPAGIGVEYPESGWITVGSEIMYFTRVGVTFTVTRGRMGTTATTHSVNDSVQTCYRVNNVRADTVIRDLLRDYAGIDPTYIPFAEWQAEFDRWGSTMILNATICQPANVTTLLAEISKLGMSIWWDEVAQRIRLRLNRPAEETPTAITDDASIIGITRKDNDSERATRVAFYSVQIDPTKGLNTDNFKRGYISIDVDAESPFLFDESITKTIYTRWLNQGNDTAAKIITGRLLNRYRRAPVTYDVKLDIKDDLDLLDVVSLTSFAAPDVTGKPSVQLAQVYYAAEDVPGHTLNVKLQGFQFDAQYGAITENSRPNYGASTEAQKNRGTYLAGPSLVFADGRKAYQFV